MYPFCVRVALLGLPAITEGKGGNFLRECFFHRGSASSLGNTFFLLGGPDITATPYSTEYVFTVDSRWVGGYLLFVQIINIFKPYTLVPPATI